MTKTDTPYVDRGDYVEFAIDRPMFLSEAIRMSEREPRLRGARFGRVYDFRCQNGLTTWKCAKKKDAKADE